MVLRLGTQRWALGLRCSSDGTAERRILNRVAVGKLTHVEVKHAWVQDLVRRKEVEVMRSELAIRAVWEPIKKRAELQELARGNVTLGGAKPTCSVE